MWNRFDRLLPVYLISLIPATLFVFILLTLAMVPAIRDAAANNDVTSGIGILIMFNCLVSFIGGFVCAFPVALILERFLRKTEIK